MKSSANYFSGGLAEIVSRPSLLTYSFFAHWFSSQESLGRAMKLLGLPYQKYESSILKLVNGELVIDLSSEEKTLYDATIFRYKKHRLEHQTPRLTVSFKKIWHPIALYNTMRIIFRQSQWIGKKQVTIQYAHQLLEKISTSSEDETIAGLDKTLAKDVWPYVLAIGVLAEFYSQLLETDIKDNPTLINYYISKHIASHDWFFRSITEQKNVNEGKYSVETYLKEYGLRADKDYELTSPRWYETPKEIKNRIKEYQEPKEKIHDTSHISKALFSSIQSVIGLQLIRSEAKRKALVLFDQLRQKIREEHKGNLSLLTRERVLGLSEKNHNLTSPTIATNQQASHGKGTPVSPGKTIGTTKHISHNNMKISSDTICIFPNASPEFAMQYAKCNGIIFQKGGQTSHGAIVAREFGIPALIDHTAEHIPEDILISIDGMEGTWQNEKNI